MKVRLKKAGILLLAASVMFGTKGELLAVRSADTGTAELVDGNTAAPEPWGALPSQNQYEYQKEELAAFCHFGPNTYSGYEWGFNQGTQTWLYEGIEPAELLPLENDFDAETLVKTLQEAGFKKLIVTAKHHDGFCIWNSQWTDYDMASTNYKDGEGDILAEISTACTKYDMNMGLYLSPWDVASPSYGYFDADGNSLCDWNGSGKGTPKDGMSWEEMEAADAEDYNVYYDNQLREILSNPKYGNNGRFVEVWMDGAKGDRSKYQEDDFVKWFTTIQECQGKAAGYEDDCLLFGAQAYTTVRWIGNELGLANEETWSKSRADKNANSTGGTIDNGSSGGYTKGFSDGNQWTVPEADARITSGWFWGDNKKTPKSLSELSNMYFNSVGHNATLLLNIPPNPEGKVDQAILDRVAEFGENIKESFDNNLAEGAAVTATEVRGNDVKFSPANVIDGDDDTYWTMNDGSTTGSLTLDLGGTKRFDLVTIEEAIQLGQRINSFTVEYQTEGSSEWQEFASGTTIGAKRICRNREVKANKIRINITGTAAAEAVPLISEVGIYQASEAFALGTGIPDELDVISVTDTDISDGAGFTYSGWTAETGSHFLGGNSMYAGAGKEATLNFTGSKVWLYGTKDSGHGAANIEIDGEQVAVMNTAAGSRSTGQMIYESEDLEDGSHTLKITNTGTVGLDAAVVLNNGGKGMLQFETRTYEVEEDTVTDIVVKRIGGSRGTVSVVYENNPGSAVQGHYDVNGISGTLVFADGEKEKSFPVRTTRDKSVTGDLYFTVDLTETEGAALGFNTSMKITIHDADDPQRLEKAKDILEEALGTDYGQYVSAVEQESTQDIIEEVQKIIQRLKAYINAGDKVPVHAVVETANRLEEARAKLIMREAYTEEEPFILPTGEEVKTAEAEAWILDASNAPSGKHIRITDDTTASNGKKVSWFARGNEVILPFDAPKAGIYKVTMTYQSGRAQDNKNALSWGGTNVNTGTVEVFGPNADTYKTEEFNIEVMQEGAGRLVLTVPDSGTNPEGPTMDKFQFECVDKTVEEIPVTGISFEGMQETELTADMPYLLLVPQLEPYNATGKIIFESSDPAVAEVTEDGLVTASADGSVVITVRTEDGLQKVQIPLTVKGVRWKEVTELALNVKEATLTKQNPKLQLKAVITPSDAMYKDVSFESSNPSVASVDENGLVTAVSDGEAVITATAVYDRKQARCKVTVKLNASDEPGKNPPGNSGNPGKDQNGKPGAVTGVKTAPDISSIKVSWNKVEKADSYIVTVYQGKKLLKSYPVTGNSLKISKLKKLTPYSVKVAAVNKAGQGADSALVKTGTCPKKTKITTVKQTQPKKAKVTFKKVKKAKGYAVFCKAGKGSYKRVGVTKKTTFVVKKLKKGKKYSFQVKAFIKNGKTFVYGKASKAKTLKVK